MVQHSKAFYPSRKPIHVAIIEDDTSIQELILGSLDIELDLRQTFQFRNAREAVHTLWEQNPSERPKIEILFIDVYLYLIRSTFTNY